MNALEGEKGEKSVISLARGPEISRAPPMNVRF